MSLEAKRSKRPLHVTFNNLVFLSCLSQVSPRSEVRAAAAGDSGGRVCRGRGAATQPLPAYASARLAHLT